LTALRPKFDDANGLAAGELVSAFQAPPMMDTSSSTIPLDQAWDRLMMALAAAAFRAASGEGSRSSRRSGG
jgi:hypothetical protein